MYDAKPTRWWKPTEKETPEEKKLRAQLLIDETASIEQRQSAWHQLIMWNATLYMNRELDGFRWGAEDAIRELWPANLRTENLVKECGEAFASKASSSPLKPTLVPRGMSYKTELAVRRADNFLFGAWLQTESEAAAVRMFDDAYWAELGCVRVAFDSRKKSLHVETVFPDNVIIDNRECANRAQPRTYRIRQVLPKASIEALYGVELGPETTKYVDYRAVGEQYEILVEAWRLPDPASGKNGRHIIACAGQLIVDEEWKYDWVPLIFFHWEDRSCGFFPGSAVEQLIPYQIRQNELNDDIKSAQDIKCRLRVLLPAATQIHPEDWDTEQGRFLRYSGPAPEPFEWQINLTELYSERVANKAAAKDAVGLNESSVNADLPSGVRLDSSAGVREWRNYEDSRHLWRWTRFEKARLEIARTLLRVLAAENGAEGYVAYYHNGKVNAAVEAIPYEDIKQLEEDKYSWTMQATPVSQMSPAARRELIRDASSRGVEFASDEVRRIIGNSNLERLDMMEMTDEDDIQRHLDIMEKGGYEEPTEQTNLTMGIRWVNRNIKRLKRYDDVPKRVIENHLKWIAKGVTIQVAAMRKQEQQAMMAQGGGMVPFAPTQGMAGTSAAQMPQA
jgi:hypothetical protein